MCIRDSVREEAKEAAEDAGKQNGREGISRQENSRTEGTRQIAARNGNSRQEFTRNDTSRNDFQRTENNRYNFTRTNDQHNGRSSDSVQTPVSYTHLDVYKRQDERYLYYSICDTGMGFSAKDMEKAFEKFYRGDEARQTKGGHSGLGLHIVKQLAELLGGDVKIKNAAGGGACVLFYTARSD